MFAYNHVQIEKQERNGEINYKVTAFIKGRITHVQHHWDVSVALEIARGYAASYSCPIIEKTYTCIVEYCNGKQDTVEFDHIPTLGTVVNVPGTDKYATVLSVG